MTPLLLFAAEALLVAIGVAALAVLLHRRLPASYRPFASGALAFVAAQAARVPLLIALTVLLRKTQWIAPSTDPAVVFAVNLAVLALSSGLFEEGARWLVLRFVDRRTRGWNDAVMFGAGHGGVEALLLVGGTAAMNVVLLANPELLVAQVQAVAPDAVDRLAAQIDALREVTAALVGIALWERGFAILLHVGLAVLVMQAVQEREPRRLLLAMAIHAGANALAIVLQRSWGVAAAEAGVTVVAGLVFAWAWTRRPHGSIPIR